MEEKETGKGTVSPQGGNSPFYMGGQERIHAKSVHTPNCIIAYS